MRYSGVILSSAAVERYEDTINFSAENSKIRLPGPPDQARVSETGHVVAQVAVIVPIAGHANDQHFGVAYVQLDGPRRRCRGDATARETAAAIDEEGEV